MTDIEFLMWLHDRLVHVHKESELFDYMHKLRAIIIATPENNRAMEFSACNSMADLKKRLDKLNAEAIINCCEPDELDAAIDEARKDTK